MLELDKFTKHYIQTALWSSVDIEGNSLDANFAIEDIAEESLQIMIKDCRLFQKENQDLLAEYEKVLHNNIMSRISSTSYAGHDFWLTRNRHGSGFWDRGLGELGEKLTEASHKFKEVDFYLGDDGMLYIG